MLIETKNIRKALFYTLASIGLFLFLFFADSYKGSFIYASIDKEHIENVINHKEQILKQVSKKYSKLINKNSIDNLFLNSDSLFKILRENNLAILIYRNDSLVFWSDKDFTNEKIFSKTFYGNWILKSYNNFVISRLIKINEYKIIGLIPIKKIYPFENKYLKSEFYDEFRIPNNFEISLDETQSNIKIKGSDSKFIFSLYKKYEKVPKLLYTIYLFLFLFFILFTIIAYNELLRLVIKKQLWLFVSAFLYVVFRYILMKYRFPDFIFSGDLFSPFYYAHSWILPSLGDLLLSSLFILHFSYISSKYLTIKNKSNLKIKLSLNILFLYVYYFIFYSVVIFLIESAINNSNIELELYKLKDVDVYTFIILIAISSLLFSFIILSKKLIDEIQSIISLKKSILFFLIIGLFQISIVSLFWFEYRIESIAFIVVIFSILSYFKHTHKSDNQTFILTIILVTSIFTGVFITNLNNEKELKIRKIYAIGISSERDYVAEMQFPDLEKNLSQDTVLQYLVLRSYKNTEDIYKRIINNYFHGYWSKYEPNITICGTEKEFEQENQLSSCNDYFNKKLNEYGVELEDTKFKFLDDLDGKISYIGALEYTLPDSNLVTIFIEITSKLKSEKLGYPKLLIGSKDNEKLFYESYSYAKYKNNKLVLQHGDYLYKLNTKDIQSFKNEFTVYSENNFNHLVYKTVNNTFIVSIAKVTFIDYLAVYSYLFVFFFILISIGLFFTNRRLRINLFSFSLKSKIQYSMIGILVLSLFTIGIGTIVLNINKTKKAYTDEIGEKTQSILVELQHKFGNYDKILKEDKEYLRYLFEKWSYVFFTDINLYSTSGDLITSSRMEVFNKNLTGRKMNPQAYIKIKIKSNTEFIHNEKIGKLSFMSAYIPFLNEENKVLGYINIPYFTKQSKITNETSELIVTLLNIYVLLFILSIFIAVMVAQNITKPLLLIQKHIGQINLLKRNEPIYYNKKDEIGALVSEYNKIIKELENSASLLAKSERESAWREMAKQIAHEIKNPLTPIKLNIQFLQKSWENKDENFDAKLERISSTIIEQIDSLSKIASDFSDFANTPKSKKEIVDIYTKIENVAQLFKQTNNVNITINNTCTNKTNVLADKEQITQVFNNLFKNAIQSVENNKEVEIDVEIIENNNNYLIKIKDNGKGIPKDIQENLFKPNFTTKSSGMGLGLAIVKNIVESCKGKIYFRTKINQGTTFFIEFPQYSDL